METFDLLLTDEDIQSLLEAEQLAEDRTTAIKLSFAILKLKERLEALKADKRAAMELYQQREEQLVRSIELLQSRLIPVLNRLGKLTLPNGTSAFVRSSKRIVYEVDEMELARRHGMLRVREEPDRQALRKAILDGQIQEGVRVEIVPTINFRKG